MSGKREMLAGITGSGLEEKLKSLHIKKNVPFIENQLLRHIHDLI